jgi:sec-independent protein translocase protein TatA
MLNLPLGFLENVGMGELLIILAIMLLLFGTRLPQIGRSLGRSISEFKSGLKEGQEEEEKAAAAAAAKETPWASKPASDVHVN